MTTSLALKLVCLIIVAQIFICEPPVAYAMGCDRFLGKFSKCLEYATGKSPNVSPVCCQGLREINYEDRTKIDRQKSCKCMIGVLNTAKGVDPHKALTVPALCNVNMPYPITTSANCAKVTQPGWSIPFSKVSAE